MAAYYVKPPGEPERRGRPVEGGDDAVAAVPYVPWRCPKCGDYKPRTYSQRGRVRYHQCQNCGIRYRSVEIDPGTLTDLDLEELKEIL